MSFCREVANAAIAMGGATLNDLAPRYPSKTRGQVQAALTNAKSMGILTCMVVKPPHGSGGGRPLGIFGPAPEGTLPIPSYIRRDAPKRKPRERKAKSVQAPEPPKVHTLTRWLTPNGTYPGVIERKTKKGANDNKH